MQPRGSLVIPNGMENNQAFTLYTQKLRRSRPSNKGFSLSLMRLELSRQATTIHFHIIAHEGTIRSTGIPRLMTSTVVFSLSIFWLILSWFRRKSLAAKDHGGTATSVLPSRFPHRDATLETSLAIGSTDPLSPNHLL